MIKVGIIGTGRIAREHATALAMIPDAAMLVAASDLNQERLREFGTTFGVDRRYTSADELIADPDIDLVTIATPPAEHEAAAVAALERGKYVLCEKPLAHTLASAARIAEADARRPGRLAVSYQMRYDAAYERLSWLCRHGSIGDVESARIERHSYVPHTDHGNGGWWGTWNVAGGGVLITQAIHELDLLCHAVGRPVSVSASMDTRFTAIESEDYVDAVFRLASGGTARCVASVNAGRFDGGVEIRGRAGTVALADIRPPSNTVLARGVRFVQRRLGRRSKPALTPHARLYLDIAKRIHLGQALPIPASEALQSLELCAAAYESAMTGKQVTLPLSVGSAVYDGVSKAAYDARKRATPKRQPRRVDLRRAHTVRIGLVGLDTSHAPTFTKILHDPYDPFHIPGARVTAAYAGGSPDMEISRSRVGGFTRELRDLYRVTIVAAPEDVIEECDLVFILASDGRVHEPLLRTLAGHGKPVFVDKPFALSSAAATNMFSVAANTNTRVFASSAFRYADGLVPALNSIRTSGERVRSCRIRCWLPIQETQGRYFWYGVHAAEMLVAAMGSGVREVEASSTGNDDRITVWHDDGRESTIVGSRSDQRFHVSLETDERRVEVDLAASMGSLPARLLWAALDVLTEGCYPRLWRTIRAGSVSGCRPTRSLDPSPDETIEVVRLLEAAQRSYASGAKASASGGGAPRA